MVIFDFCDNIWKKTPTIDEINDLFDLLYSSTFEKKPYICVSSHNSFLQCLLVTDYYNKKTIQLEWCRNGEIFKANIREKNKKKLITQAINLFIQGDTHWYKSYHWEIVDIKQEFLKSLINKRKNLTNIKSNLILRYLNLFFHKDLFVIKILFFIAAVTSSITRNTILFYLTMTILFGLIGLTAIFREKIGERFGIAFHKNSTLFYSRFFYWILLFFSLIISFVFLYYLLHNILFFINKY